MSHFDLTVETKIINPLANKLYPGLPQYSTEGAAAFDLKVLLSLPHTIRPGESASFATGLAIHINNPGVALLLIPRSGLGSKGLILGNSIGLIDSDYQGEIFINLYNRSLYTPFEILNGMRVAQALFIPTLCAKLVFVDEFSRETERGTGGFGSTGNH